MNTLLSLINSTLSAAGLTPSISPLSTATISTPLQNSTFSIDVQTENSNKYRDKNIIRLSHNIKISFIKQHGLNAATAQTDSITAEEVIIRAMLAQSSFAAYRVSYINSNRILTFAGEYVLTEINLNIEQDLSL